MNTEKRKWFLPLYISLYIHSPLKPVFLLILLTIVTNKILLLSVLCFFFPVYNPLLVCVCVCLLINYSVFGNFNSQVDGHLAYNFPWIFTLRKKSLFCLCFFCKFQFFYASVKCVPQRLHTSLIHPAHTLYKLFDELLMNLICVTFLRARRMQLKPFFFFSFFSKKKKKLHTSNAKKHKQWLVSKKHTKPTKNTKRSQHKDWNAQKRSSKTTEHAQKTITNTNISIYQCK